jgi:phage tail-like protein
VSGLGSEIEIEDYREGGVNGFAHKLPGTTSYDNIELKHGLTAISTLWNWYHNTSRGVIQRKNGTIMLLDPQQIPVMWWNFRNALPVRWTGPTFDATSDEVGVETVELAHEGLTMPLLGQAGALGHGAAGMAGLPGVPGL